MTACERCGGTGLKKKGFWLFSRIVNCDGCDGTGRRLEFDDSKRVIIDGDKRRMQEVFHAMAEARRKKAIADGKGKNTFGVNRLLNRASDLLKEKNYSEALEKAKEADAMASTLL